jgi:ribosomal protein L16 Arg81 hydroxylase
MAQVYGRKKVTFVPSSQLQYVYNETSYYSEVDVENPNYERFPLFKKARRLEATVGPGDMLLVPVGWWHHMRALDISISVSLTNFIYPNRF